MATTRLNEHVVPGDNVERAEGSRSEGVAVVTTLLPGHNTIAVRWRNDPKAEWTAVRYGCTSTRSADVRSVAAADGMPIPVGSDAGGASDHDGA